MTIEQRHEIEIKYCELKWIINSLQTQLTQMERDKRNLEKAIAGAYFQDIKLALEQSYVKKCQEVDEVRQLKIDYTNKFLIIRDEYLKAIEEK